MEYRLVIVTHGKSETLPLAVASFAEHVATKPAEVALVIDGQNEWGYGVDELLTPLRTIGYDSSPVPWIAYPTPRRRGFCRTTARAWQIAAWPGPEGVDIGYVYWLEHDFLHSQYIDLRLLAGALEEKPYLAQMSLMRQPVNEVEVAAGGLVESRPDEFEFMGRWLEHRSYWTTNPSLFPRSIAMGRSWPTQPKCEGIFTASLLADRPETRFGVWGNGEPRVEHIGQRDGFGY